MNTTNDPKSTVKSVTVDLQGRSGSHSGIQPQPPGSPGGVYRAALLVKEVVHRNKGNPRRQIKQLVDRTNFSAVYGCTEEEGARRAAVIYGYAQEAISELRKANIRVQNISEFSQRQFRALVRVWQAESDNQQWVMKRVRIFREFCRILGKPHVVPKGDTLERVLSATDTAPDGQRSEPRL